MPYLLDTNTVSYILKGQPVRVREHLLRVPIQDLTISVITEAELLYGAARHPEAKRLALGIHEFLIRVRIAPWTSDTARSYGNLRAELERKGTPIGNLDLMIAAQALADKSILVSSDRVFQRIKSLQVEDWTKG